MLEAGRAPTAVVAVDLHRNGELCCQIVQYLVRNHLLIAQAETRMPKQTELKGDAKPVAITTPGEDKLQLLGAERIVPDQCSLAGRDAEKLTPLIVGQQVVLRHKGLPQEAIGSDHPKAPGESRGNALLLSARGSFKGRLAGKRLRLENAGRRPSH